jgi:hypothetical protein
MRGQGDTEMMLNDLVEWVGVITVGAVIVIVVWMLIGLWRR